MISTVFVAGLHTLFCYLINEQDAALLGGGRGIKHLAQVLLLLAIKLGGDLLCRHMDLRAAGAATVVHSDVLSTL